MGIPANTARVSIKGSTVDGEIFEWSVWVSPAPTSQSAANTLAAGVVTALADSGLLVVLKQMLNEDSSYDSVRVYSYPTGGPTSSFIGEATITSGVGTDESGSLPLQVACCVTLLTGMAGRRHRGRCYLPATGFSSMGSGHVFSNSRVDALGTAFATWVGAPGGTANPVVVSFVAGSFAAMTQIKIDNRPDIQRRRANKQGSTHTKTAPVT